MMDWKYSINLKSTLELARRNYNLSDVEAACPTEVLQAICTELQKANPLAPFVSRMMKCRTVFAMNRILEEVYVRADRFEVYLGDGLMPQQTRPEEGPAPTPLPSSLPGPESAGQTQ